MRRMTTSSTRFGPCHAKRAPSPTIPPPSTLHDFDLNNYDFNHDKLVSLPYCDAMTRPGLGLRGRTLDSLGLW